ncbi:MAG: transposase [Ignavibacteriales bacterium]|nr:transposase [Ignavibacteriales bacterium]
MQPDPKIFYRRRLPHYQPPGETFHVTFRLAGSLPVEVVVRLKHEHEAIKRKVRQVGKSEEQRKLTRELGATYFDKYDGLLDRAGNGPTWLGDDRVASVVMSALLYRDGNIYDMLAACVMPNHVHVLMHVKRSDASLYRILQSLKSYTAVTCNACLNRSGAFWHHESYDHVIRDGAELERTIWYILENPVKAGLCRNWRDWRWTYVKKGLVEP